MGAQTDYPALTPIPCLGPERLRFSGTALRFDDLLLMAVLRRGVGTDIRDPVQFSASSLLSELGWSIAGTSVKKVVSGLNRLCRAVVELDTGVGPVVFSILAGVSTTSAGKLVVFVDPSFIAATAQQQMVLAEARVLRQLGTLPCYLYLLSLAAERSCFALDEVAATSGSSLNTGEFRRAAKKALALLDEQGLPRNGSMRHGLLYGT